MDYFIDYYYQVIQFDGLKKEVFTSKYMLYKELERKYLIGISAYLKQAKLIFKIKKLIPIYINNRILLFPIKCLNYTIYINFYHLISCFYDINCAYFYLKNGQTIKVEISKKVFDMAIKKVLEVSRYFLNNSML